MSECGKTLGGRFKNATGSRGDWVRINVRRFLCEWWCDEYSLVIHLLKSLGCSSLTSSSHQMMWWVVIGIYPYFSRGESMVCFHLLKTSGSLSFTTHLIFCSNKVKWWRSRGLPILLERWVYGLSFTSWKPRVNAVHHSSHLKLWKNTQVYVEICFIWTETVNELKQSTNSNSQRTIYTLVAARK